jgi:hypothetical protein
MRASNVAFTIACGPIICAYVVFAACFCPARLRRRPQTEEKKRFERRQKLAPRPLPVRSLERSLTIPVQRPIAKESDALGPSIMSCNDTRGQTLIQTQSRVMRLPLELRQLIYRAVLGDSTFHIILKNTRKLGHLRCKANSQVECPVVYSGHKQTRECCWGTVDAANIWAPLSGQTEPTDGDIIPFLQTCRQVYSEAIEFLYSTNTFSISDLDCLRYLSCTVLPCRFQMIQKIQLEWSLTWPIYDSIAQNLLLMVPVLYPPHDEATWEATWRIIAEMPNLKKLLVSLVHFEGFNDPECEKKIFAPLMKVSRPTEFQVVVTWPGREIRGAPFRLFRPPATSNDSSDDEGF